MSDSDGFPWEIGVHDAHCHPTDTMASIAGIPEMKATTLTVMATRGQDQDLVLQAAQSINSQAPEGPDRIIPCFGWHPWFSHQIIDDTTGEAKTEGQKEAHYSSVLVIPADDTDFAEFVKHLPEPKPLSSLIAETRERLKQFPKALLDGRDEQITPGSREGRKLSPYKVKIDHQRAILKAQLQLAGEMRRAVSVHSVQAHGTVFDALKELWAGHERVVLSRRARGRNQDAEGAISAEKEDSDGKGQASSTKGSEGGANAIGTRSAEACQQELLPFPPRICMHSYSGPPDQLRQFMAKTNPSDVYFSFSSLINFTGAHARKVGDVIKALPEDRILIESDLHTAGPEMDDLLEDVARQVCGLREWELRSGVQKLADNWKRFVYG
ncbi:TatD family [Penicillium chermesinum]|uniref:TatD family n=1 Tax=Penicillium chermesinum TaxID=63820 RepID=A0A9W9PG14_9EURO|nr:TatD family [Penicillium chermesinum]KAJ5246075.1 TatD family [Penicillium chermesinum]